MDVDKIKHLIQLDKLKEKSSTANRYPVRFIFMELTSHIENEIFDLVESTSIIEIADYLSFDDAQFTRNQLHQLIQNKCSKDTFVIGFSEMIRFMNPKELQSTIFALLDIENNYLQKQDNHRIYFICFSMKEYIDNAIKSYSRKEFYNPIINSNDNPFENLQECFFVVDKELSTFEGCNIIHNNKEWLNIWHYYRAFNDGEPIFNYSKTTSNLYKQKEGWVSDSAYKIDNISNYKEFITKSWNLDIPFKYNADEIRQWKALCELISNKYSKKAIASINDIIADLIKTTHLTEEVLLDKWISLGDHLSKWLVYNYIRFAFPNSLVTDIFSEIKWDEEAAFFSKAWTYSYEKCIANRHGERSKLLLNLSKYRYFTENPKDMQNAIYSSIEEYSKSKNINSELISDLSIDYVDIVQTIDEYKKYYYKDYFDNVFQPNFYYGSITEKRFFVLFVALNVVDKKQLQESYPDLYYYLYDEYEVKDTWVTKYLREYRFSKLVGQDTDGLIELIEKYNKNEDTFYGWYYQGMTRLEGIKNLENANLYVIDGLGAEYIPFILYYLNSKKLSYDYDYTVATLPSITSVNKKRINNVKEWYLDFDTNVIHKDYYQTTKNISLALDTLRIIMDDICEKERGNDFVITSDHGSTARSKWSKVSKKYSFDKSDHEGRCLFLTDELYESNQDYISFKNSEDGYNCLVALKNISLNNNPRYEVHGGATPEEVYVPVIRVNSSNEDVKYRVNVINSTITGLQRSVRFTVTPTPLFLKVYDEYNNETYVQLQNGEWSFNVDRVIDQRYRIKIKEKDYFIDVLSGHKMTVEEDDFDD